MYRVVALFAGCAVMTLAPLVLMQAWTLATTGGYYQQCGCVATTTAYGHSLTTRCPEHEQEFDEQRIAIAENWKTQMTAIPSAIAAAD